MLVLFNDISCRVYINKRQMIECVWKNGGMILTEETEVLGEKHYTAWVVDE
jgi:hypothetical protein